MDTNITGQDDLDILLSASYSCLRELEAGRFENLERVVVQHKHSLMNYMQGKALEKLAREQQEKLYQILSNQKTAIKLVNRQKQQVASKIQELRNGRNLKTAYNIHPL